MATKPGRGATATLLQHLQCRTEVQSDGSARSLILLASLTATVNWHTYCLHILVNEGFATLHRVDGVIWSIFTNALVDFVVSIVKATVPLDGVYRFLRIAFNGCAPMFPGTLSNGTPMRSCLACAAERPQHNIAQVCDLCVTCAAPAIVSDPIARFLSRIKFVSKARIEATSKLRLTWTLRKECDKCGSNRLATI